MQENAFENDVIIPIPTADPSPPPSPARPWYWWIVDYNPFYLISAALMLLGSLALSNTMTWSPIPLPRLLVLLATLQVYELAALAIGVFLYLRFGGRRDAIQLLLLVLLFAVDVSFLMSEIATDRLVIGAIVSATLFAFALLKVWLVLRAVGAQRGKQYILTGVVGLAFLYAIPVILTAIDDGRGGVNVLHFYALWWIVGLSPLVLDAARKLMGHRAPAVGSAPRKWLTAIALLPWLSLAIHAGVLQYVYDRPYFAAMAAPMLIGLALLLRGSDVKHPDNSFLPLRIMLIAAAALLSLTDPSRLAFELPIVERMIGTKEIGLAAAWLALAVCNIPRLIPHFIAIGVAGILARIVGPSVEQLQTFGREVITQITRLLTAIIPKTRIAWGIVAVAGAFISMLIGLVVSLKSQRPREEEASP